VARTHSEDLGSCSRLLATKWPEHSHWQTDSWWIDATEAFERMGVRCYTSATALSSATPLACDSAHLRPAAPGLKILVSAVRFRPWALTDTFPSGRFRVGLRPRAGSEASFQVLQQQQGASGALEDSHSTSGAGGEERGWYASPRLLPRGCPPRRRRPRMQRGAGNAPETSAGSPRGMRVELGLVECDEMLERARDISGNAARVGRDS